MQDRQPIKRSPQLAPLSREHHDGLLYVWKIRQGLNNGTPANTMRNYTLWYWKEHTKPHFFQEEKILLPYMPPDHPFTNQLKNEHAQIRELVLSLDREADLSCLRELADLAERHIRWEERTLFPWLEKQLTEQQLIDIKTELENHPLQCDEWTEVFWVNK